MSSSNAVVSFSQQKEKKTNQNIQVYVRVRPLNTREKCCRSLEMVEVLPPKEIVARHGIDSKLTKKFTFDRTFGPDSRQVDVYSAVVAPLIDEVLSGYNCTVFAYGQTGTGKTHTMVGTESAELKSSWEDNSEIGIIPRALCHLFDELRMMQVEFMMRISYLELYNEELCDLLSSDDSTKIRIFDDSTKKGSVIIQGLEEIPVHSKDDVYKLLEKGKERRKTASTLMNAQSSRSHTVFSIVVHIRENGLEGEELVKIGKLNLVDLAGSENSSKAGNEKGIRSRETVNINQSLLTLGRVITALVERTPHIPYRESKLTRLLQESLGGRTKTSIIATISPGHKDIEESISTLEYAHRAKNIQNKPEINQKLNKRTVLKEYSDEIDKLKRDLAAARDKNGIYLPEETYGEMTLKMESQNRELNEKVLLLKALKEELANKERMFNEISLNLVDKTEELKRADERLFETKKILNITKRRYKEKKVLLQSHVKTEEALIQQAKELLHVVDAATNDTEKLQGAIERRKEVDNKIENTCENFHSEMCNNLKYLNDSLRNYKELHSGHSRLLVEEFKKCSNIPQRLTNSNKQELKIMLHECKKKNLLLFEEFLKQSDNLSEECKLTLETLFESLEMKENALKGDIQSNLYDIETFNEKMKNSLEHIRITIGDLLEGGSTKAQEVERIITADIGHSKDIILNNIQVLQSWLKKVEEEKDLQKMEEAAFTHFVQTIQDTQKRRLALTNNMSDNINNLLESNKKLVNSLCVVNKEVNNLTSTLTNTKNMLISNLNKEIETEDLNIDNNLARCATIQTQLENLCEQSKQQLDTCRKVESTYLFNTKAISEKYCTSHKRSQDDTIRTIVNLINDIDMAINNEAEKIKQHAVLCESLTIDLSTKTDEYSEQVNKQLLICHNMLQTFKQNDLQTYLPTGQTPTKREFAYSRVLAMTSPHMKIVQRFREAKAWSDFDTTGTIDEETDIENDQNDFIGPTKTISNSTPLKGNFQKCFREETSSKTSNLLSVSVDPYEKNAFSSIKSPIKRFPSYNQVEENKENVLQSNHLEEQI